MVASARSPAVTQELWEEAANSYIVVFRDDVLPAQVRPLATALAQEHGAGVRFTYQKAIKGFSATMSAAAAKRLEHNPMVKYVERNGIAWAVGAPDVEAIIGQARFVTPEPPQEVPYGITRVGGPLDGTGKHAWVIDTGIDLDHPDLNVGPGANFIRRGGSTPNDGNGHGTHVAGTIAAINNAIDVVGVAANATVHPVRVLDNNGSGTIDSVVAGVDFVAQQAQLGDAANMSLGAPGHFQSLHDAVFNTAALGIRFAIAAGNSSADANLAEPAHVEHPNIFTVSAIDIFDAFAGFSNFGNPPIDFAAPGVGVLSTRAGGGTVAFSGTSMAAPHVAGLLLFGQPVSSGFAFGDPDGNPDPIAHH
jgi:subtilisin family serine protease